MAEILSNLTPNKRFLIVIQFALIISLIEVFAQYHLKTENIIAGIVFYAIIALILFKAYKYEGLGHMNLVWSCVSIIMAYVVGSLFFGEPTNKYTVIAIIFAMLAILFAHFSDE